MEIPTALDLNKKGTVNKQWYKHFLSHALMALSWEMGIAILLLGNRFAI